MAFYGLQMLLASCFCSPILQGGKGKCAPFWEGIKNLSGIFKARLAGLHLNPEIMWANRFNVCLKQKNVCLKLKTSMLFTKMHDLVKSFWPFLSDYFVVSANLGAEGQPHVDYIQERLLGFTLMFLTDLGNKSWYFFPNTDSLVPAQTCIAEQGTWEYVFLISSLGG